MTPDAQSLSFAPQAVVSPGIVASIPYDECVERLARTVDKHDDADLDELASLISQLAVVIEI